MPIGEMDTDTRTALRSRIQHLHDRGVRWLGVEVGIEEERVARSSPGVLHDRKHDEGEWSDETLYVGSRDRVRPSS